MPSFRIAAYSVFCLCVSMLQTSAQTAEEVFESAAKKQFATASRYVVPAGFEPGFALNTGYPSVVSETSYPWDGISFQIEPERYIRTVLDYALEGNVEVDWHVAENAVRLWYHAPWMHFGRRGREPVRGLTLERGARPLELHQDQTERTNNWAVGFYNSTGAVALGDVWRDPARPDTETVVFPVGTVSVKLLFTDADAGQVPYLADTLEWQAQIVRDGTPTTMRLLQVDVAVRDERAETETGWIFGTFVYRAEATGATVWDRLVPVGLHWGNDPARTIADHASGQPLNEGWMNPTLTAEFYALPRKWLGLWGRMNGPVDNSESACLACHGRAMDLGESGRFPPFTPDLNDAAEVLHYFANRGPTEPFFDGFRSLDYSLQLSDGLGNYRAWVRNVFPDFIDDIYGDADALVVASDLSRLQQDLPDYLKEFAPMLLEEIYESPFSRAGAEDTLGVQ